MLAQLSSLMVTSLSVGQNTLAAIIMQRKEKKSQKSKIPGISSTKKAVAKAKCPIVNDLVKDLANIVGSIFI